jgi:arginine exporter protein ArgO
MVYTLLQGFIFGIAYVAPIGIQNLFVINTATNNDYKYVLKVTFAVIFFDISLALACFIGVGMWNNIGVFGGKIGIFIYKEVAGAVLRFVQLDQAQIFNFFYSI